MGSTLERQLWRGWLRGLVLGLVIGTHLTAIESWIRGSTPVPWMIRLASLVLLIGLFMFERQRGDV